MSARTVISALVIALLTASAVAQEERQGTDRDRGQRSRAGVLERFDRNKDGVLERAELPEQLRRRFDQIDRNRDGKVTRQELEGARAGRPAGGGSRGRSGEKNTPPARGERHPDRLKVGDLAPDFTLPDLSGKSKVTLSSFRGKKPVVLIFASYT